MTIKTLLCAITFILSFASCKTPESATSENLAAGMTAKGNFHLLYTFPSEAPENLQKVCYEICPSLAEASEEQSECIFSGSAALASLPDSSVKEDLSKGELVDLSKASLTKTK